jgi:hypothetical protein
LTFYPGTELYEKAKKEGFIKNEKEEIYKGHYWNVSPTYLNKIFFLVCDYAVHGEQFSTFILRLLTNKILRKVGISSLLYACLRKKRKQLIEFTQ